MEVDRDELSKLVSQGTELAKEIQEIERNRVPRSDNKNKENNQNNHNKDKDKKPTRSERRKKGVNEVDAEENTPSSTTDALQRSPCSQGPQLGRSQDGDVGSAEPSQSGVDKHKGTAAGGRPGPAPSRGGGVRASEGTNPCTRPSFVTKNVFDVLQDLSESILGTPPSVHVQRQRGGEVGRVEFRSPCPPLQAAHRIKPYLGFGVPVGSAYLSARRTFGRG